MSKKTILGVIGFIGVGLLFLAPVTHAATAPESDLQTRVLLGQTLNVLQSTLNQIGARIANKTIEAPQAVNASLDGIKSALITLDAYLKSATPATSQNGSPLAENGSPAVTYGTAPQTATLSWFVGPKPLFVLLPVAVLVLVAFALFRKKTPKEIKTETVSEATSA